ncbi:hypothetical protein GJR88_01452 [Dietzia sp. DQ12-45-1b]|nr:hypothetical protein GJR88_01452 [Dietzia sp. DQ12-45-1b]
MRAGMTGHSGPPGDGRLLDRCARWGTDILQQSNERPPSCVGLGVRELLRGVGCFGTRPL